MSVPLQRLSIPVFVRGFGVLSTYLHKARAHASERGIRPEDLINARLAEDMMPLGAQIQRASDTSKNAIVRLTGVEAPRFADTETSFAELHARIDNTLAFFASVPTESFEGAELREVTLAYEKLQTRMNGEEFLLRFALPNFFFHVATSHAILRQQGIAVGKLDYLGPFD